MMGRSSTRSARYPPALADLDRYRKLICERVIPAPRGVSVDFIDTDAESGILVIDVPVQPSALLPFVVPGTAGSGGRGRLSVAVPVREADATVWLPQTEIQRLLAAGWTAAGGPSEEYLSDLIQQAVTATRRISRLRGRPSRSARAPSLNGQGRSGRHERIWPGRVSRWANPCLGSTRWSRVLSSILTLAGHHPAG